MRVRLVEHDCKSNKCLKKGKHSKVTCSPKKEAKGVSYEIANDKGLVVGRYDLDDCAYPSKEKKEGFKLCDYIVVIYKQSVEDIYVWVETKKTSDLDDACEQILNSYKNAVTYNSAIVHYARVVLGRNRENKSNIKGDNIRQIERIFKSRFDVSNRLYDKDMTNKLYLK